MFKANSSNVYIASKSQSIKPDVISDVGALDQIRLNIPSFVSFLDPQESYFKFNLQMTNARGIIVPNKKGGAHSLFRNVIIRDGNNNTTLENIEDYNSLACMVRPYTEQASIRHKRELMEGVQHDANNSGASLYYGAPVDLTGATNSATAIGTARTANVIECYLKLRAGIFKGGIVPLAIMNGLRLQIDTEDALRALHQPFVAGCAEVGVANCAALNANLAANAIGTRGAGVAQIGSIVLGVATTVAGANNNFAINDKIYISHTNGGSYAANEVVLGVITGFFVDGGNRLGIRFIKQYGTGINFPVNGDFSIANATRVYYKMSDRNNPNMPFITAANGANNTPDGNIVGPSYNISNIEMLCSSVQPPNDYVSGMMKKALTGQGVSIDYMTSELHRYNQVNTNGVVQIQVPTLAKRAKAIMVQPVPVSSFRVLEADSFSGVPDSARNYQFVKGNELVPSRIVNLERYSQAVAQNGQTKNEPLHTAELQKALLNIEEPVFSLQKIANSFAIARSFNKYGQITDLSDETLSLRVDYNGGVQKVFNSFIFKLARLTVANGQVSVIS
tara:strand:+ start:1656 stop:3341 length:1686 start_codon:yes stop_codon:yes gene_type:complete